MKNTIMKLCFVLCITMTVWFVIRTITDYTHYSAAFDSAPFTVFILVNALCFLLPAAILLVIGLILRKKR